MRIKERSTIAVLSLALLIALATTVNIVGPKTAMTSTGAASAGLFADAYADTQCENAEIAKITASAGSTRSPENAIDNNLATRWTDEGIGSWIKPDLGKTKVVCYVDIMWYKGDSRIYNLIIYTSEDGSNWKTVHSGKSSGKTLNAERYDFADSTARWIKVRVDGNQWQNWNDITEIDVYTQSSTAPPRDTQPPTDDTQGADTIAPNVAITNPTSNSVIISSSSQVQVTVQGTASDDLAGVSKVEVRVDAGAYVGATPRASGDWSSWTATVNLDTAGTHKIESRATDNAGNQASSVTSVTFQHDNGDRTNPTVVVLTVMVSGSEATVQGTSSDSGSGVKLVEVKIDNGAYVQATPQASGDWSSWTARLPVNADTFSITARATDNAGNQGQSSINVSSVGNPPAEEPPVVSEPADKYFMATMLQYVDTNSQVNMYKPYMILSDKARIHVGLNKQVTNAQLDGLLSLPGSHGMEYFSLAEIKANAPLLKAKGIEFIDYDLEPGTGHSPSSDLADPVASIRAASKAAHDNGLLFQCSPSKKITTDYGAQLAQYCDQYHIQAQSLQGSPSQYESFVKSIVAKLRQNNPDIVISVQLSTQRESASGMSLLETMKHDFARVADDVDGVSLWFANNDSSLNIVESFAKWFDANYH
jgi:hypothetical protein